MELNFPLTAIIAFVTLMIRDFIVAPLINRLFRESEPKPYTIGRRLDVTYTEGIDGSKVLRTLVVNTSIGSLYYEIIKRIYDYKTDDGYMVVKRLDDVAKDRVEAFLVHIDKRSGHPIDKSISYSGYCNHLIFKSQEQIDQFIKKYLND